MKKLGRPFFLATGFVRPHLPLVTTKPDFNLHTPGKIKGDSRLHFHFLDNASILHRSMVVLMVALACSQLTAAEPSKPNLIFTSPTIGYGGLNCYGAPDTARRGSTLMEASMPATNPPFASFSSPSPEPPIACP